MRGRHAIGPEMAERVAGSDLARRRLRVVLETIAGSKRVLAACEELGISEQRFEAIRQEAIQAGVAALEPKPAGRPPAARADAEVVALHQRIAELEAQVQAAELRAELAMTLPRRGDAAKKL
jgi:Helix-turn-helix domain